MAFHIEYRVAAKPDVVLATIRREAPYVRESQIPQELRAPRTFGVAVRVRKDNFHLYREDWNDPPDPMPDLRGRVEPADSGSRIVGRVGVGRGWIVAPLIFGALAMWSMVSDQSGGLILLALSGSFAFWDFINDRSISREDPIARHLVERLEIAVSQLEETSVRASAESTI